MFLIVYFYFRFAEKEKNCKKEGDTDEVTSTSNNIVLTEPQVNVTEMIETIIKTEIEVDKETVTNGKQTSTIVNSSKTSNIVTLTIEDDDSIISL